jgi:hypothetical protein
MNNAIAMERMHARSRSEWVSSGVARALQWSIVSRDGWTHGTIKNSEGISQVRTIIANLTAAGPIITRRMRTTLIRI